ncbi:MAG: hypothetical protein IJV96_04505 [Clostridia bacterium]|nr:hypothetical protein [Clostridia bacterium]
MRRTKKITLTALFSALSVVLLLLGTLSRVLDLSAAGIACCFVVFLRLEVGGAYPVIYWGATSALSLLIYPSGGAGLFFALFGLYPLLKALLERLPRILEWLLKLLVCAAVLAAYVLLAIFVFRLEDTVLTGWMLPVFLLAGVVVFVLFDIALSRLIVFYSLRLRARIAHLLK